MKKSRKLVLHRETLHALELRGVAGGDHTGPHPTMICPRTRYCDDGTYNSCPNTMENCSAADYCETGGGCTSIC